MQDKAFALTIDSDEEQVKIRGTFLFFNLKKYLSKTTKTNKQKMQVIIEQISKHHTKEIPNKGKDIQKYDFAIFYEQK